MTQSEHISSKHVSCRATNTGLTQRFQHLSLPSLNEFICKFISAKKQPRLLCRK